METTIRNEQLTVVCDSMGGEQRAITSAEGIDYLWDGDARFWKGRAPHPVSVCGAAAEQPGPSRRKERWPLPRHGLARTREWAVESADRQSVTYYLSSDAETKKGYPYDFEMRIRHFVKDTSVTTAYDIRNSGKTALPFCVGAHPGYRIPLDDRDSFEDYVVEFEYPETADCPQVNAANGLLIDSVRNRLLSDERSFRLNHVLFRGDALIFDRLKSRSVRVYSPKSGRGLRMDFEGFDYFGIWSSPGRRAADLPGALDRHRYPGERGRCV